ESTVREHVERGCFFGENGRIAEIHREHVRTDPQCRRGCRCRQQRRQRRGAAPHVVTHQQHVVAERLRFAGGLLPLGARAGQTRRDSEAKGASRCGAVVPAHSGPLMAGSISGCSTNASRRSRLASSQSAPFGRNAPPDRMRYPRGVSTPGGTVPLVWWAWM